MNHAPIKPATYCMIFAALVALTIATVALAHFDLGVWHGPVGLGIAALKAALIALFFMHIVRSSRLTWAVALAGVFWLSILIGLTLTDVLTRDWPL